jgi:rubrerythrin
MKVDFSKDEIKVFDFDELEAYRIARKMERDGVHYYTRLAEQTLKPRIREVVEMLIADEKKHLSLFEGRITELCHELDVFDEDESLADIIDSRALDILKDSEEVAGILCNPQEALRLGISAEKRSIAFYNELIRNTSDESGRVALTAIIAEEEEHLDKLKGLLRE